MTRIAGENTIARRDLLKGSAALVVSINIPLVALTGCAQESTESLQSVESPAVPESVAKALNPEQLDSWLAIDGDGFVTGYWGKMDMGQGVDTAIAQIVAEELDVDVNKVSIVSGNSALCIDQGGASGSNGLQNSGVAFQAAAAEARLVLVEKAAAKFDVSLADLRVADGTVTTSDGRSISYATLVEDQGLDAAVEWNGKFGNNLALSGRATPKPTADYKVVGTSVPRKDIRGKILARTPYLHDHSVPNMLHGRTVRPRKAGARVQSVHADSISDIPGARVVREKDFVGVVAETEWDAIRAAKKLVVEWDESDTGFPTDSNNLFRWIRNATPGESKVEQDDGNVDEALAAAARTITAEYEWPFQSHARMAPAAAVVDVKEDKVTVWTDSQKPFDTGIGAGLMLDAPLNADADPVTEHAVHSIWMPGPGSYGRSDAGDGAMDAVLMSAAVGAPVRVQWTREEGHAWDPKGPASVVSCRAGLDAGNDVNAYHYHIKGFTRHDQNSREDHPSECLAGHLIGHESTPRYTMSKPADSYRFANKRYSWDALGPLRLQASPLRTSHFRDPYGPEVHFASESFIDEMAFATGADPLAFRLAHVTDERDAAVLQAAADIANWTPRTAPQKKTDSDGNLIGTGIAYAQRGGSVNAVVAEVIINPNNGHVRVRRIWVGADHGLIVNPFTLERTIEGNLLQAISRTIFEEVKFDRDMVRSVDWQTYPILEAADAPDEILFRHINRPELGPRGAGEPTTRIMPPAIANAIFDASGVRLRRVPLTPKRVLAALQANS